MSPTGDLLVTTFFLGRGHPSSLLRVPHVLRWHGTELVAAHPSGINKCDVAAYWGLPIPVTLWVTCGRSQTRMLHSGVRERGQYLNAESSTNGRGGVSSLRGSGVPSLLRTYR